MRVTEGGSYEELVDPRLENNYDPQEMLRMVHCAGACIRHSARRRPKMSQVRNSNYKINALLECFDKEKEFNILLSNLSNPQIVRALEGDVSLEDLNEGVKAANRGLHGSSGSSEYESGSYSDLKKIGKTGLSSQEFNSSEHRYTGEYVHSSAGNSQEFQLKGGSRIHNP